jgi:F-type H+-transporting ATPase subunit b
MPRQPIKTRRVAALVLGLGLVAWVMPSSASAQAHAPAPAKGHAEAKAKAKAVPESGLAEELHEAESKVAQVAEAHEVHGEPNPLEVQPNLAVFTVLVFLGLLFVLGRFAWKPLLAALHQREEHLEHVLHETERARNESESLLAEHRRRLAAAEDQVRALIDEARKNAQSAADEIVRKAQAEADASRQRAEREIGSAKDQALSEIWSTTADLAVSVAGKVLGKSLSEDDHRRLIDAAVGELPEVRASANGHGGARA